MDTANTIRKGEDLDWGKLDEYLNIVLPEWGGNLSVHQFHGGHANLTYLLQKGERELVLRRPPFGKIAPGAHDMKREYRVLSKLYRYFDPAPQAFHYCEDDSIIGAPFVLIERRHGVVIRTKMLDCFKKLDDAGSRVADAMIKAQADLHLVDYQKADLSNLGKPEGFLKRQLSGWEKRWNLSKLEEDTSINNIINWLNSDVPSSSIISIVHNDIKLDNCQFQPDNPDRVTAIFDWDMCTLGDPLTDFGTTLSYWPDERIDSEGLKNLPVQLKGNFPSKSFLIERYQSYTGFDMSRLQWYEVFSYWKSMIIAQQLYKRYVDGDTQDERMKRFGISVQVLKSLTEKIMKSK